jgi:hypothetical protein
MATPEVLSVIPKHQFQSLVLMGIEVICISSPCICYFPGLMAAGGPVARMCAPVYPGSA